MSSEVLRTVGLWALAIGLAVLLWLTVTGQSVVERGLEVPLEFENVPRDLEIVGEPPDVVRVRVRGASGMVSSLEPGEIVAVLDLDGERPGPRLFDLFAGTVRAPFGIEVTQIVPATITVTLERVGAPRVVEIVPDVVGTPADGYVVGRISSSPPTVDVVGPESRLERTTEALTEPVSVEGATEAVTATVTVGVADPIVRLRGPVRATVTVEVVQAPIERTFHEVRVAARPPDLAGRVDLEPALVTISVRGPRDVVRSVPREAVAAFIDLAGMSPGRYTLPIAVESRGDLGVTHIDPPFVHVTLR